MVSLFIHAQVWLTLCSGGSSSVPLANRLQFPYYLYIEFCRSYCLQHSHLFEPIKRSWWYPLSLPCHTYQVSLPSRFWSALLTGSASEPSAFRDTLLAALVSFWSYVEFSDLVPDISHSHGCFTSWQTQKRCRQRNDLWQIFRCWVFFATFWAFLNWF